MGGKPYTPHLKRLSWATPFCESYVEVWHTFPSPNRWTYPINYKESCQKAQFRAQDKIRTHPPSFTFSIARSTAGCQIPFPRNVSMTCPFRKNAENTLGSFHKAFYSSDASRKKPYGLVKQISAAPIDQRVVLESKYVAVGRIPHIRGSSSLTSE